VPGCVPAEASSDRRTPLTSELKASWSPAEIWRAIQRRPSELNGLNVSFSLNKLAKVGPKKPGKGEAENALHLLEEALLRDVHTYSARSLATALHSLAKLQRSDPIVFHVAQQRALEVMTEFTSQGLSILLWAYARTGIHAPALFEAANHQVLLLAPRFSPVQTSMTLWAYTQVNQRGALAVYLALQQQALRFLKRFNPDELTTIAWTFSATSKNGGGEVLCSPIFAALEAEATRRESEFSPNALVRMLHSFAAAGQPAPLLMAAVEQRVVARPTHFSASEISRLAHSCTHLGYSAPQMFAVFGQEVLVRGESFQPRDLAIIARAAATLDNRTPKLLAAVEHRLGSQPYQFSPQDMAMVCRAFAVLRQPSKVVFDVVGKEVVSRPGEFKPQELANIVWAHAKVNHTPVPGIHETVASLLEGNAEERGEEATEQQQEEEKEGKARREEPSSMELKPQEICNIVWAYVSMGRPLPAAFSKAKAMLKARPEQFEAQDLASLAWACAKDRNSDEGLLAAVWAQAMELAAEFTPQGLASVLWAASILGRTAPALLPALEPHVIKAAEAGSFSPQGLTMALRGYMSRGTYASAPLFRSLARQTVVRAGEFSPQGLRYAVWAFAVASCTSKELANMMTELCPAVVATSCSYNLRELTQLLRAYTRAGGATQRLLEELGRQVGSRARDAKPAQLVMAAVSLSSMLPGKRPLCAHHTGSSFLDVQAAWLREIAQPLASCAEQCDPRLLAMAATAYSRCTCSEPELFESLEAAGAARVADFTARQMADLLEAFRRMGYRGTSLFAAFEARMVSKEPPLPLESFKPRDIATVSRAFAQLGHGSAAVVVALQHLLLDVLEIDGVDSQLHPGDVDALRAAFSMHACSRTSMLDALPPAFLQAAEHDGDEAPSPFTGSPHS